ncbi:MAG TPA: hypothetical protein PKE12_02180 [Kiritimatiellia bacterium]|nr:hypothetical protein [Kiritimatiellia bacterium]
MARVFVRVEGVNMDAFIFSTRSLSVIRGAGLTLLDAAKKVAESPGPLCSYRVDVISKGASMGLFRIEADKNLETLRKDVQDWLVGRYPHATFVVDAAPVDDNASFRVQQESLLAANRWRQAMGGSFSFPEQNTSEATKGYFADALEGLQPADESIPAPKDKGGYLSRPVKSLLEKGRMDRQWFYADCSGAQQEILPLFTDNFEEIAEAENPLKNKMAVFYADGNGFGKIQRRHCQTVDAQKDWDKQVQAHRRAFLTDFINEQLIGRKDDWQRDGKARFETLMWGGDEMIFVMPATLGWRFASFFFKEFENKKFEGSPLTYTAALVFCHHHAPIERIKDLSKNGLAEFAKGVDRGRHQLITLALESYDSLGEDAEAGLQRRYQTHFDLKHLILHAPPNVPNLHAMLASMAALRSGLRDEGSGFARSQLRALVHRLLGMKTGDAARMAALAVTEPGAAGYAFRNCRQQDSLKQWADLFPASPLAAWIHLEELWDYALS